MKPSLRGPLPRWRNLDGSSLARLDHQQFALAEGPAQVSAPRGDGPYSLSTDHDLPRFFLAKSLRFWIEPPALGIGDGKSRRKMAERDGLQEVIVVPAKPAPCPGSIPGSDRDRKTLHAALDRGHSRGFRSSAMASTPFCCPDFQHEMLLSRAWPRRRARDCV